MGLVTPLQHGGLLMGSPSPSKQNVGRRERMQEQELGSWASIRVETPGVCLS